MPELTTGDKTKLRVSALDAALKINLQYTPSAALNQGTLPKIVTAAKTIEDAETIYQFLIKE